ncbi:MAG: NTP transferase domain-containing protein [Bacteroidales bacterium]|nr:NTP transferase domain-containing protein [Bacteroidales bacterium]
MKITAIILAAGDGKRFADPNVNKTAIKIGDKSLVQMGLEKVEPLVDELVVVVGHKKQSVIDSIKTKKIRYVLQKARLGTGHAVKLAIEEIERGKDKPDHIFVANGDHLFQVAQKAVKGLFDRHIDAGNDATILTSIHSNPVNRDNGRIKREGRRVVEIIERRDFTLRIRKMNELNSGNYIFKYSSIKPVLDKTRVVAGHEFNIVYSIFKTGKVGAYVVKYEDVGPGINTRADLEETLKTFNV